MNIKRISAVLLALLLACTVASCGKKDETVSQDDEKKNTSTEMADGKFTYGPSGEGTLEITGYIYGGTEPQDVVIPTEFDGREVTGIGDDAFKANKVIKSVTIPEGITYIGSHAFYDCDEITAMVIPNSVTAIGVGAFQDCDKLASVTLSTGLKAVERFTFYDCTVLGNVVLPEGLERIDDAAFWNCASITEVTIPASVKDLGTAAFYMCEKLEKVTVLGEALGKMEIDETLPEDDADRYIYHPIGEIVFKSCASNMLIYVTAGTEIAKYVEDNEYNFNVVPKVEEQTPVTSGEWLPNA